MEHARDFIFQAESRVKDITGLSLKALIKSDKVAAINALIDTIKRGDTSDRKAAYFALGQIGEDVTLQILDQVRQRETAAGLLGAISGANKAIFEAPASKGFTDSERRVIIEEEYYRYNNPNSKPPMFAV